MLVLSLCDGISTGHHVLNFLEVNHDYMAVEICETKKKISNHNSSGITRPVDDIYKLLKWLKDNLEIAKKIDLVLCGFTCTSLSSQGKRELFDGASKIFFECVKILDFLKSINPKLKFFFENVASMPTVCRDKISELLGVEPFLLNAGLISAQARNRYYWKKA